jgi:hypothetical protein
LAVARRVDGADDRLEVVCEVVFGLLLRDVAHGRIPIVDEHAQHRAAANRRDGRVGGAVIGRDRDEVCEPHAVGQIVEWFWYAVIFAAQRRRAKEALVVVQRLGHRVGDRVEHHSLEGAQLLEVVAVHKVVGLALVLALGVPPAHAKVEIILCHDYDRAHEPHRGFVCGRVYDCDRVGMAI